jgi:uncharacterized protein YkwD
VSARITLAITLLALAAAGLSRSAVSDAASGPGNGGSAAPLNLAPGRCDGADQPPRLGSTRQAGRAMLCLLNRLRREHGLTPLRAHPRLTRVAQAYSGQMVSRRFFSHVDGRGNTVSDRLRAQGYLVPGTSSTVGENLAWATGTLAAPIPILQSWQGSPSHRAVIMRAGFEDVGVGVAPLAPSGGAGATYTVVLGTRG